MLQYISVYVAEYICLCSSIYLLLFARQLRFLEANYVGLEQLPNSNYLYWLSEMLTQWDPCWKSLSWSTLIQYGSNDRRVQEGALNCALLCRLAWARRITVAEFALPAPPGSNKARVETGPNPSHASFSSHLFTWIISLHINLFLSEMTFVKKYQTPSID